MEYTSKERLEPQLAHFQKCFFMLWNSDLWGVYVVLFIHKNPTGSHTPFQKRPTAETEKNKNKKEHARNGEAQ